MKTDREVVLEKYPEMGLYKVDDDPLYMLWNYRPKIVIVGRDIDKLYADAARRIREEEDKP